MSGHAQPAEKSSLATVKRSKLVVLDAFDTASAAFVGKFMDVSYFTCLDDIANAIDDLIALEDITFQQPAIPTSLLSSLLP